MKLIFQWNVIVAYSLLYIFFFEGISAQLDENSVRYEYFQFTPKYSEFIITYDIKSNSSLKLNETIINDPSLTNTFSTDMYICGDRVCHPVPKFTEYLKDKMELFCNSTEYNFTIPLYSFPSYEDGDTSINDILRYSDGYITNKTSSNKTIKAALFIPRENQSIQNISQGYINININKYLPHRNVHIIPVKITDCTVKFLPSGLIKNETRHNFTTIEQLQYPDRIFCNTSDIKGILSELDQMISSMNYGSSLEDMRKNMSRLLYFISKPSWNQCHLLLNEITNISILAETIYNTTDCYYQPFSEEWLDDTCCNDKLLWDQCCEPRTAKREYDELENIYFKGRDNQFITPDKCDLLYPVERSNSSHLGNNTVRLLFDFVHFTSRIDNKNRGCNSIVEFDMDHYIKVIDSFSKCLSHLYGESYGVGNSCTDDSECLTECDTTLGRCKIPWISPSMPLTKCFHDNIPNRIRSFYYNRLGLNTDSELAAIEKKFNKTYTDDKPSCIGPISKYKENEEDCLSEMYCNWKSCELFPIGSNCKEICTEKALPTHFCGYCENDQFGGTCKDVTYPRGCSALTANDINKCNALNGSWSESFQTCFLPGIDSKTECIIDDFCPKNNVPSIVEDIIDDDNMYWNRTICPGGCFDRNRNEPECIDENCDHPCCDTSKECLDKEARECVCKIDAYCCDSWDETCNRKVVEDGCVNCNCVRRKWDDELNLGKGICKVLIPFEERCEDPYFANATWWSGREWSEGRFANKERCSVGVCDINPKFDHKKCTNTYSCINNECYTCKTSKENISNDTCLTLSLEECARCEHGLSTCKLNQTEAQCVVSSYECKDKGECTSMGVCDDDFLKSPFGACIFPFNVTDEGTGICNSPFVFSPLGCINQTIRDPKDCHRSGRWIEPAKNEEVCRSRGYRCREVRERSYGIEKKIVYTYNKSCKECEACGGTCEQVFHWTKGIWKSGEIVSFKWMERKYQSINIWDRNINTTKIQKDLNITLLERYNEYLLQDVLCRYNPEVNVFNNMLSLCNDSNKTVDLSHSHNKFRVFTKLLIEELEETISISPAYIHINQKSVPKEDKKLLINVYFSSMLQFFNMSSEVGKRIGFVDVIRRNDYIKGMLVGDGIEVELVKGKDANGKLQVPMHICFEKRFNPPSILNNIFISGGIVSYHSNATGYDIFEYIDEKEIYENGTTLCIKSLQGGVWFYIQHSMAHIRHEIIALVFMIIFLILIIPCLVQSIRMGIRDNTQFKWFKLSCHILISLCAIGWAVLMSFVIFFKWDRVYPDYLVYWTTIEWPARMLFSAAISMYIFSKDDELRLKVCESRLPLWPIIMIIEFVIGGAFYFQIFSLLPSKSWDDNFIHFITSLEKYFIYTISLSTIISIIVSGLWTFVNRKSMRNRIELAILLFLGLGHYIHLLVWYSLRSGWQGYDFYMINLIVNLPIQIIIMIYMILTLNPRRDEYKVISDKELKAALLMHYDDGIRTKDKALIKQIEKMSKIEVAKLPKKDAKKHLKSLQKKINEAIENDEDTEYIVSKFEDSFYSLDPKSQKMLRKTFGVSNLSPDQEPLSVYIQKESDKRKEKLSRKAKEFERLDLED